MNSKWPPQYIWVTGGGTPTVLYKITVTLRHGTSTIIRAVPNSVKKIILKADKGYVLPETVIVQPASALKSFDRQTGELMIVAVSDVSVTGECVGNIPHTHEEMSHYTYSELTEYTHGQLNGETKRTVRRKAKT